jgi:hypothetical protein
MASFCPTREGVLMLMVDLAFTPDFVTVNLCKAAHCSPTHVLKALWPTWEAFRVQGSV